MESELLKLKNNYEFWDLFFKLDNNEEISFNDLEYLIWSIIKLKYENLNNDEKIELKKKYCRKQNDTLYSKIRAIF